MKLRSDVSELEESFSKVKTKNKYSSDDLELLYKPDFKNKSIKAPKSYRCKNEKSGLINKKKMFINIEKEREYQHQLTKSVIPLIEINNNNEVKHIIRHKYAEADCSIGRIENIEKISKRELEVKEMEILTKEGTSSNHSDTNTESEKKSAVNYKNAITAKVNNMRSEDRSTAVNPADIETDKILQKKYIKSSYVNKNNLEEPQKANPGSIGSKNQKSSEIREDSIGNTKIDKENMNIPRYFISHSDLGKENDVQTLVDKLTNNNVAMKNVVYVEASKTSFETKDVADVSISANAPIVNKNIEKSSNILKKTKDSTIKSVSTNKKKDSITKEVIPSPSKEKSKIKEDRNSEVILPGKQPKKEIFSNTDENTGRECKSGLSSINLNDKLTNDPKVEDAVSVSHEKPVGISFNEITSDKVCNIEPEKENKKIKNLVSEENKINNKSNLINNLNIENINDGIFNVKSNYSILSKYSEEKNTYESIFPTTKNPIQITKKNIESIFDNINNTIENREKESSILNDKPKEITISFNSNEISSKKSLSLNSNKIKFVHDSEKQSSDIIYSNIINKRILSKKASRKLFKKNENIIEVKPTLENKSSIFDRIEKKKTEESVKLFYPYSAKQDLKTLIVPTEESKAVQMSNMFDNFTYLNNISNICVKEKINTPKSINVSNRMVTKVSDDSNKLGLKDEQLILPRFSDEIDEDFSLLPRLNNKDDAPQEKKYFLNYNKLISKRITMGKPISPSIRKPVYKKTNF